MRYRDRAGTRRRYREPVLSAETDRDDSVPAARTPRCA